MTWERGQHVATQRRYMINETGKRTAVVVNIREFERMRRRLEDLEDALELKTAVNLERDFRDLRDIQAEERLASRRSAIKR